MVNLYMVKIEDFHQILKAFLTLISKMIKFDLSGADFSPRAEKLEPWICSKIDIFLELFCLDGEKMSKFSEKIGLKIFRKKLLFFGGLSKFSP